MIPLGGADLRTLKILKQWLEKHQAGMSRKSTRWAGGRSEISVKALETLSISAHMLFLTVGFAGRLRELETLIGVQQRDSVSQEVLCSPATV